MEKSEVVGLKLSQKEGVLISDKFDRRYYSGVDIDEGYLLISKHPAYFTDSRYFYALKEMLKESDITPVLYTGLDSVKKYLKEKKIKKLFIDYRKTTIKEGQDFKKLKVKIRDASAFLEKGRAVKNQSEIEKISTACKIIESAVSNAIKKLKVGVTENEIRESIIKSIKKAGGEGESFSTIVAFGKNSAVPHHQTGETKLQKDSAVLIDTGAVYKGYCSDITRTVFFGKPSEKFIKAYDAVKTANERVIENIAVGTSYSSADALAREVLEEHDLDKYFTHGLGHGLGLEIHEFPTLSKRGVGEIKENDAFTIEPGVYFDGEFGIRIEDTVVVENGKIKRLFSDEKELLLIEE